MNKFSVDGPILNLGFRNRNLPPFQKIDIHLAKTTCNWFNSDSALLFNSILLTSAVLQQGHSCLYLPAFAGQSFGNEVDVNEQSTTLTLELPELAEWENALKETLGSNINSPFILENHRLYLRRYQQFEVELSSQIKQLQNTITPLDKAQLKIASETLDQLFKNHDSSNTPSDDWQKLACANALFSAVNIISGGPGTGKTYTVTRVLALLLSVSHKPLKIALAAPTGKAAQRLGESIRDSKASLGLDLVIDGAIPSEAQTLHRLLGVIPNQNKFRHHEGNKLDIDLLLVDEVSMVDLPLMNRLFRALPEHARVVLLGDSNQLPSVAAGSVLADIAPQPHPGFSAVRQKQLGTLKTTLPKLAIAADSHADHVTFLTHSRRFEDGSGIGLLAKAIISGDANTVNLFDCNDDLHWLDNNKFNEQLRQWTQDHFNSIAKADSAQLALTRLSSFRILCAERQGERGVEEVNLRISNQLNPSKAPFFKGQPIMITENHYGLKLFNGDIGIIWPEEDGTLLACFDTTEALRKIAPGRLPQFETVYAMTIHKTQGSEFDHVVMVLPEHNSNLLSRELIYTGLTRAKNEFSCYGNPRVWTNACKIKVKRFSGLADRLK